MSFSGAFARGAAVGKRWKDDYRENQEREVTDKLFTAGKMLAEEGTQIDAEGREIEGMGELFSKASVDDIAGHMIKTYAAQGNKITDDVARLSYGAAEQMVAVRRKGELFADKREMHEKKMSNYNSMIGRRDILNSAGAEYEELTENETDTGFGKWATNNNYSLKNRSKKSTDLLFKKYVDSKEGTDTTVSGLPMNEDGSINYKAIKVGGKIFDKLPDDHKRTVLSEKGLKGTAKPKAAGMFDDLGEEEPAAPAATSKRESRGSAPKGVANGKYTVRGEKVEVIDGVMYAL